jgi:hypothetical protein
MCARIHAAREAAHDYQPAIGQIDRNLVAIQKFNISANIEQRRRIINFAQTLRVQRLFRARLVERDARIVHPPRHTWAMREVRSRAGAVTAKQRNGIPSDTARRPTAISM